MADTMQFDLVSPERSLASFPVTEALIPGADGDMTAMPDHAPVITTLRPGILKVDGTSGPAEFLVFGGFDTHRQSHQSLADSYRSTLFGR